MALYACHTHCYRLVLHADCKAYAPPTYTLTLYVGRAGRQRVPSLAVALLAVARFAPPLVFGAALPAPSVTCLHVSSSKERRGSASG